MIRLENVRRTTRHAPSTSNLTCEKRHTASGAGSGEVVDRSVAGGEVKLLRVEASWSELPRAQHSNHARIERVDTGEGEEWR